VNIIRPIIIIVTPDCDSGQPMGTVLGGVREKLDVIPSKGPLVNPHLILILILILY